MTVTFFSNFLNHHQVPFCDEMYKRLGSDFSFVATTRIPEERLEMGYHDYSNASPYSINSYENKDLFDKAILLGEESDVVILGSAPEIFIKKRLRENKLTFRYSERFFKQGVIRILDPRVFINLFIRHTLNRYKNIYMLCASAYTAYDVSLMFAYPNKCYRWGYFPYVHDYDIEKLLLSKPRNKMIILWVGRFLSWKHPENSIYVAKMLRDNNHKFILNLIGDGEELKKSKELTLKYGLEEFVKFLGTLSPEEVRRQMLKANIFLFTSNREEGWGAVINEAMNSGCAVVASKSAGSVPFLIEDQNTGLIFETGNLSDLYKKAESLLINEELRLKIARNAYYKTITEWSPEIAANRFINLSSSILKGNEIYYDNGPCSKTVFIK